MFVVIAGDMWARYVGSVQSDVVQVTEDYFTSKADKLQMLENFRKEGFSADSTGTIPAIE